MSIGFVRALRVLHRAFGHYPPAHRIHILIRFFTCPFLRTVDDVPIGTRVLEIGSGHGLFGVLITEERAREVIAVEPDLAKSVLPSPSAKIRKVAGYDESVRGTFDVVVVYDVTYRMPAEERREFFRRAFDRVAPGGLLLWKDMDPAKRLKMRWARFQEILSDRFLGISLGEGFVHQSREESMAMLRGLGFTDLQARAVDFGYVHPHLLYTARRPAN